MSFQSTPTELKNFFPLCKLGQGSFSTVYKVKRMHDGQVYALKKIKMQKLKQKQQQNALNQIRILASIKSKYIISYKQAFYDQSLNLLCIVMQCADGGDLQKIISDHQKTRTRIKQEQVWTAASQIMIGLYELHQRGILHRDLKGANVFVSNNSYKLGDLNVSKVSDHLDQMARTQTGTPYYASPEVGRDQPYDNKCDIWSYGCLLYEMCCFEPPFKGADLDELYQSVQKGYYRQIPSVYSPDLALLIKLCLKLNPKERPSAKQLIRKFKTLNDKFISSIRNNQIKSQNQLLSTIRLPFDLKDLSKNLPLAEYEVLLKQQPQTMYEKNQQNIETVMLKKNIINQKQRIQPLPERIKEYFNQNNKLPIRKRPQRPQTSSKRRELIDQKKCVRPVSAEYIFHQNNLPQKISNKLRTVLRQQKSYEIKNALLQKYKIVPYNIQRKNKGQSRPLQNLIPIPLTRVQTPKNKYRCKSSSNQKRTDKIQIVRSPGNSQKNRIFSGNRRQNKYLQHQVQQNKCIDPSLKELIPLNQRIVSIKRISSLENKIKYIRQQRKQRKVGFEKNKENVSCIIKPSFSNQENLNIKEKLKQKINQNSQIFRLNKYQQKAPSYIPTIKQRNVTSDLLAKNNRAVDCVQNIKRNLQNRKDNLYSERNVVSAESKRVKSYTSVSNQECRMNEKSKERKSGMIRKIPVSLLPSIAPENRLAKERIGKQLCVQEEKLLMKMQGQQLRNHLAKDRNMIDNSETIIRLKKRINNRMIGYNSQQRQLQSQSSKKDCRVIVNNVYC